MIKLYDTGAYLVNGTELVEDSGDAKLILRNMLGKDTLSREEAAENTIAYRILKNHNTSGNMEKLKIKFDKLTSHDITLCRNHPDGQSVRAGEIPDPLCADQLP